MICSKRTVSGNNKNSLDNILLFNNDVNIKPGDIDRVGFRILMELCRIDNPRIVNALEAYFVDGISQSEIILNHDVSAGYLSQRIRYVKRVYKLIGIMIPYYSGRYVD